MADVFISYKREERQAVERLAQQLRRLGLDVWFDASLNAGEAFSDEIDREAHAAKVILVCWSPTARESKWVKAEALIGFEHGKLAACYVAGPDGFYPPTPFNSIHAEDLRAWVGAPSNTHAGYKSILRRIGTLCGRSDIESFGALDVQAPASVLRAWVERYESSPLFMVVDELLRVRDVEEAERARLEQEARERRAREEAERRAREDAARQTRGELERRKRAEKEAQENQDAGDARQERTIWKIIIVCGVVVVLLFIGAILNAWQEQRPSEEPPLEQAKVQEPQAADAAAPPPADQAIPLPEMVRIPGQNFEVGRYEVTFAQWDACVADGGCNGYRPNDQGWGRGARPVINVSWNDAQAYVQWLNQRTGQRYRMLTSAEWEIAARAGAATSFSWGDHDPVCDGSAYHGAQFYNCTSNQTLPVGSFQPNAYGLYDVHGNVWEWVEDCHDAGCSSHVLRGGSWVSSGSLLRFAAGYSGSSTRRSNVVGFRIARTV